MGRFLEAMDAVLGENVTPDRIQAMGDYIAEDVVWREAGNAEALQGREAVLRRLSGMTGSGPSITVKAQLEDENHAMVFGHADFGEIQYDYVELYALRDGKVVERWSFMDAVPDDVSRYFANLTG